MAIASVAWQPEHCRMAIVSEACPPEYCQATFASADLQPDGPATPGPWHRFLARSIDATADDHQPCYSYLADPTSWPA